MSTTETNARKEQIDAALALPAELTAPDGRVFKITEWAPVASVSGAVTATIRAIVLLPPK